jgi:lipid A ethanolaminephosphotransferase
VALLFAICNGINIDKLVKWFHLREKLDYLGILAFLAIGLCTSIAFFALLFCRKTTKPIAIIFVILSATATYFIKKYDIAIDRSMIMNAINTDPDEVHSLLSIHMIPYILFLMVLPIFLIVTTEITFKKYYFLSSLKLIALVLVIGVSLLYARFDSISRAVNLSKKYVIHSLTPINYVQGFGSIIQNSMKPYFSKQRAKKIEITGQVTAKNNLVVVLAIGETSRQKSFSLYGYKRNTNPILSKDKKLHLLNGKARIGSTLYALPEILMKDDVPLPAVTHKLGVETACYANYTLYDNCVIPGEVRVSKCGHGGVCYDEDVIPLLSKNLKSYKSGQRFIVLHIGGGSHGPSYYERYPKEFQRFQPVCFDADVVNQCSLEQLYNAYDNTILYVDYVVANIIKELDNSKVPYVFIYLSDHGESLMEDGHIFHGMPPGIALPPEQSAIPLIVKSSVPIKIEKRSEYSQQDIFDTVLDLLSIETNIGEKKRGFIKKQ